MMEQPGHWIAIEPTAANPLKLRRTGISARTATIVPVRPQIQAMATQPTGAPRLPDIHPGTPPTATVRVEVRVIKDTPNAFLVGLLGDPVPSRTMWLPRSVVGNGQHGSAYGQVVFFAPPWLYRKMQKQL
jgi:hypothetical protein